MSFLPRLPLCRALAIVAAASLASAVSARAQFVQTDSGPHDYNSLANWVGGVANGQFTQTLTANQTVTFSTNTTLSDGLHFALGGTNALTLRSDGVYAQTISLVNDIVLDGTSDVVIGSHTANEGLSLDLGSAPRKFDVTTDRTLTVHNGITGSAGAAVNKYGAGTMVVAGSNGYSGGTLVQNGTLQVLNPSGSATGSGTVTINGAATLQIGESGSPGYGAISGSIVNHGTLQIDRPDSYTFASSISGTGDVRFGYGSTRIVMLTGANTYTGNTVVLEGHLADGAPGAFSSGSTFALNTGAFLDVNFNETIDGLTDGASGAGTLSLASSATLTINTGADTTFSGPITGPGRLAKTGAGAVTLKSASTYSGGTTINAGRLILANPSGSGVGTGTVTVGASGTLEVGSFEYSGMGSLTSNIVNDGIVTFIASSASTYSGGISGSGMVALNGSDSTFTLAGNNTYSGDTRIFGLTLNDAQPGAYSPNSRMIVAAGSTLNVNSAQTIAGLYNELGGGGDVMLKNDAALTIATGAGQTSAFAGPISGVGTLIKSGPGALVLSGTNTYSGDTTVIGGTLAITSDSNLGGPAVLALNGGTLQLGSGLTSARAISLLGSGGVIDTHTFEGTFSGVISGTGALVHQGPGVLTLAGANTYTGGTTVQGGGVIDFSSNANLGANASGVTLNGGFLRTTAAITDFTHPIMLTSAGGTINIYGRDSDFSGAIYGSGSLTVISQGGGGMLTLSGASVYAGATDVQSGTLKIATDNALPTTTFLSLASGAALEVAANQLITGLADAVSGSMIRIESGKMFAVKLGSTGNNSVFGGLLTGEGEFKIGPSDGAAVVLTSDNGLFTGHTTIDNSGVLQLGAGGSAGMVRGDITNNGTLTFYRSGPVAPAGVISGSGQVNIGLSAESGPVGTVTFGSGHTYGGGTNVYAGRLLAMNSTGSATGSGEVNVYSGAVFGGTGTISGPLKVESGGIVSPGVNCTTPGKLSVGATTFGNSGQFDFAIKKAEGGILGSDLSLLSISGALTITADENCRFVVNLYSATDSGAGLLADFDPTRTYSWMFASANGGVSGFAANAFQVNTANFQNSFAGDFSVGNVGDNLFVNYTPVVVPEPSTWALLTMGLSLVGWLARRRRN